MKHSSAPHKFGDSLLAKILFAFFSLVICEFTLWLLDFPVWMRSDLSHGWHWSIEVDPVIGWKHKAGIYEMADGSHHFTQTFEDRGTRLTGLNQASDGKPHIIFLGDSYVEGFGLSDQETFTWKIAAQFPQFIIENYGTGGYGAVHSYLQLKSIAQSEKNIKQVFYLFNAFDESRSSGSPNTMLLLPWEDSPRQVLIPVASTDDRSGFTIEYKELAPIWSISRWSRTISLLNAVEREVPYRLKRVDNRDINLKLISGMAQISDENHFKFRVLLGDGPTEIVDGYQASLSSLKIESLALNISSKLGTEYRLSDGHPNAKLNQEMAEVIANWL